ncbi:hypothetical protein PR202_ga22487 [Eleusine coracana subsp. coracana]|uniref:Uncharacterized protein n=1 Tax=Eleusine coracana subsp. coracana TaxID=191504 RepID=A0AAV5D3A8_ELECO|nr:hypothetical protein PR202_ga22487 [Eleusine coracana subsp. coracana]
MFCRLLAALGFSSSDPTAISSTPDELSASAIVAGTISGSHVLTIAGYSQSKELIVTGKCATSRPFTVPGHRWVLQYFPNGEIPATSDSIAIYLKLDKHIKDVKCLGGCHPPLPPTRENKKKPRLGPNIGLSTSVRAAAPTGPDRTVPPRRGSRHATTFERRSSPACCRIWKERGSTAQSLELPTEERERKGCRLDLLLGADAPAAYSSEPPPRATIACHGRGRWRRRAAAARAPARNSSRPPLAHEADAWSQGGQGCPIAGSGHYIAGFDRPARWRRAALDGNGGGSHVLTIDGYSQTKELLGTGEYKTSRSFTVGGHRWLIVYFPSGKEPANADCVSIYIKLEKDSTDIKARVKFSLLDKDDDPVPRYSCPRGSGPEDSTRGVFVFQEMRTEDRDAAMGAIDVPAPDLGRHLGRLLSGGHGADVTFEVAGETFPAHRYILAARSPVFMAELFGSMEEKMATCVRIADMEARVFKALLHFIYTDLLPDIAEGDMMVVAQHLLVASDRYGMERMRLVCEEKLRGYIDASTVGVTLALAEQHGCVALKKACFQFLMSRSNLKTAMATDGFSHLTTSCPSIVNELLAMQVNLCMTSAA